VQGKNVPYRTVVNLHVKSRTYGGFCTSCVDVAGMDVHAAICGVFRL